MQKSKDKRLKIAIFSGEIPSTTFIERLIVEISEYHEVQLFGVLKKRGSYDGDVRLIITPGEKLHSLLLTAYRTAILLVKRPNELFKLLQEIKRYKDWYSSWIWFSKLLPIVLYKPDIFHIQWARDLQSYWFLQEKLNIPIVISLRGAHINYTPIVQPEIAKVYRELFPKVKGFHAVSKAIAAEAENYGAKPSKIKVIHSPLNKYLFKKYSPKPINREKPINLVSVGRLHWKKGYSYALKAMLHLKELGMNFKYTIIGSNEIPEEILFQIHQFNLQEQVSFSSSLQQEELFEAMKCFDILLLASVEEGIANVVLEAMALGIPVVSTDCGGMSEVVIPNKTGWLVPVRNPEAMARAIVKVINTPENKLSKIKEQAHNFVKTQFGAETSTEQFLNLYSKVMKKEEEFFNT